MTSEQAQFLVEVMRERDALKARVAEVEKERDEAREEIRQAQIRHIGTVERAGAHLCRAETAESSLAASRRQVEGLREALEPFAKAWDAAIEMIGGKPLTLAVVGAIAAYFTNAVDFRKASAALSALDAPQPESSPTPMESITELWADLEAVGVRREDKRDAIIAEAVELLQQFFNGENTSAAYEAWKHAARAFIEKHGAPKPFDEMTEEELLKGLEQMCSPTPEGIEVTPEMIADGLKAWIGDGSARLERGEDLMAVIYRAMRAKEPKR